MTKFILRLSNGQGHYYMLYANVEEGEVGDIRQKIAKNLVIRGTHEHWCAGHHYSAKDPEIMKQLKDITGYDFFGLSPDLSLSFGGETFRLPGGMYDSD